MNKEEILAKSRAENRGRDEADLDTERKGAWIGWAVGIIGTLLVSLIDRIILGDFDYGLMLIFFLMGSVVFFYKYHMLKKKLWLLVALCYAFSTVLFLTAWLLQLLKII